MKNALIIILVLLLVVGCSPVAEQPEEPINEIPQDNVKEPTIISPSSIEEKKEVTKDIVQEEPAKEIVSQQKTEQTQFYNDTLWMRMDLQNVITNEIFTIDSFKGQRIIVESYSDNCNTCGEQKLKLQSFIDENNESFTHISLNTDRNAVKENMIKSMEQFHYDWTFVLSSKELRDAVVKEFGKRVVRYDLAPLLLVCEDQSAYLLEGGLKGPFQLKEALSKCD